MWFACIWKEDDSFEEKNEGRTTKNPTHQWGVNSRESKRVISQRIEKSYAALISRDHVSMTSLAGKSLECHGFHCVSNQCADWFRRQWGEVGASVDLRLVDIGGSEFGLYIYSYIYLSLYYSFISFLSPGKWWCSRESRSLPQSYKHSNNNAKNI